MSLKSGNKDEIEDPMKTKEKRMVEKLKLKYKGENKRQVRENEDFQARKRSKLEKTKITEENEYTEVKNGPNFEENPAVKTPNDDQRIDVSNGCEDSSRRPFLEEGGFLRLKKAFLSLKMVFLTKSLIRF